MEMSEIFNLMRERALTEIKTDISDLAKEIGKTISDHMLKKNKLEGGPKVANAITALILNLIALVDQMNISDEAQAEIVKHYYIEMKKLTNNEGE